MCNGYFRKASACLNYSLGSCIGFCFDDSAKVEYKNILREIRDVLNGKNKTVLAKIELNMNEAQIIYSYLQRKQNNCRCSVISGELIDGDNSLSINVALAVLFEN
jgi:excinuclease UvrABC nuclease subunit